MNKTETVYKSKNVCNYILFLEPIVITNLRHTVDATRTRRAHDKRRRNRQRQRAPKANGGIIVSQTDLSPTGRPECNVGRQFRSTVVVVRSNYRRDAVLHHHIRFLVQREAE